MRKRRTGWFSLTLLSLLTLDATPQATPRTMGQVPKQRVAVNPPRLSIGAGELTRAEEVLRSISVGATGSEATDAFGTLRVPGTGQLRDGTTIAIAHARPAAIE